MFDPGKGIDKLKAALSEVTVPTPTGQFVPYKRVGRMIYLSGQTCSLNDVMIYRGAIGAQVTMDQGEHAARICMLNLLAALGTAVQGNYAEILECMSIKAYVQVKQGDCELRRIVEAASDLLMGFGTSEPSWTMQVLGSSALPGDASVEIEAVFLTRE